MEQPASPAPKRRARQRSAAAEAAILKAAMGLLGKKPPGEVTAEAAGAHGEGH
jgi:hypothetical protein